MSEEVELYWIESKLEFIIVKYLSRFKIILMESLNPFLARHKENADMN